MSSSIITNKTFLFAFQPRKDKDVGYKAPASYCTVYLSTPSKGEIHAAELMGIKYNPPVLGTLGHNVQPVITYSERTQSYNDDKKQSYTAVIPRLSRMRAYCLSSWFVGLASGPL